MMNLVVTLKLSPLLCGRMSPKRNLSLFLLKIYKSNLLETIYVQKISSVLSSQGNSPALSFIV